MQQHATTPRPRIRRQLALAFGAFILLGATDGATGVLLPSLQAYYHVSKGVVGFLFLALTTGYMIAGLSSGLLVARLGQRRFLMLGAVAFAVGAASFSVRPPFVVVLATTVALGVGFAVIDAGLNAVITALPDNTTPLNNLHAFYGIGGFLGPIVASGVLAIGFPWSVVYILWAALSLALLAGFRLLFTANPVGAQSAPALPSTEQPNLFTATLRLRVVWLAALFLLFYVGAEISLGSWSYSFLTEVRQHGALLSGWAVSGYWLGITLGRLTLARLAARLRVDNQRLIRYCLLGAVIGVACIWVAPIGAVSAFGLWLTGYSLGPIFPTTIALVPSLVPPRLVPSAVGFLASTGSMGAALFPWLAGNLAHAFGLWSLLPYVIALILIMSGGWLALRGRINAAEVVPLGGD